MHLRGEPAGPLTIDLSAKASKAQRVVAIGANLTAITEACVMAFAAVADVTAGAFEPWADMWTTTAGGGWGHPTSFFLVRIVEGPRDSVGHTPSLRSWRPDYIPPELRRAGPSFARAAGYIPAGLRRAGRTFAS